jgi:hypothetical protein
MAYPTSIFLHQLVLPLAIQRWLPSRSPALSIFLISAAAFSSLQMLQPPSPAASNTPLGSPFMGPVFSNARDLLQSPVAGDLVDLLVQPPAPPPAPAPTPLPPVPAATSHLADLFMAVAGLGSYLLHARFISDWASFRPPTMEEQHQRMDGASGVVDELKAIDLAIEQLESCKKTNLEWLRRHSPFQLVFESRVASTATRPSTRPWLLVDPIMEKSGRGRARLYVTHFNHRPWLRPVDEPTTVNLSALGYLPQLVSESACGHLPCLVSTLFLPLSTSFPTKRETGMFSTTTPAFLHLYPPSPCRFQ